MRLCALLGLTLTQNHVVHSGISVASCCSKGRSVSHIPTRLKSLGSWLTHLHINEGVIQNLAVHLTDSLVCL